MRESNFYWRLFGWFEIENSLENRSNKPICVYLFIAAECLWIAYISILLLFSTTLHYWENKDAHKAISQIFYVIRFANKTRSSSTECCFAFHTKFLQLICASPWPKSTIRLSAAQWTIVAFSRTLTWCNLITWEMRNFLDCWVAHLIVSKMNVMQWRMWNQSIRVLFHSKLVAIVGSAEYGLNPPYLTLCNTVSSINKLLRKFIIFYMKLQRNTYYLTI